MKRNDNTNNTYREIEHNDTRVKILDKTLYRIKYKQCYYIVPRAQQSWGTTTLFDMNVQHADTGHYHDAKNGKLWINEEKEGCLIIECKMQESITTAECEEVMMTIFREGDGNIVMQYPLGKSYDGSYHFVDDYDCETLPEAGRYIAIVSGMQHANHIYNYNSHYMIVPFTVCKGDAPHNTYIKSAQYTLSSTEITGSTQPLEIDLQHHSTAGKDTILKALCFDSEMNLVAHSDVAITTHNGEASTRIAVRPDFFWIENERYTLVLNDTTRAIATLSFDLNHEGVCHVVNGNDIEPLYRNTLKLNKREYSLLQEVSGMRKMRTQIFEQLERTRMIEELNENVEGINFNTSHHAIIYTDFAYEKSPTLNRAYALSKTLMKKSANVVDCQSAVEEKKYSELFDDEEVSVWTNVEALCKSPLKSWQYLKEYIDMDRHIILYDSRRAIDRLLKSIPQLQDLFDTEHIYHSTGATAKEIAYRFFSQIESCKDILNSEKAMQHIYHTLAVKEVANECLESYLSNDIRRFLRNFVAQRAQKRILAMPLHKIAMMGQEVKRLQPEDIDFNFFATSQEKKPATQEVLGSLNAMIGLHNIKQEITALSTLLSFNQQRARLGLKASFTGCHHMIFTGNPGTGKTTVAKMIGRIFYNLGLLSSGEVVVTERSKILGRYIGDTENNMREIINSAKGGVLFIDEAYTLCRSNDDNKDFGRHAIEALLTILAEEDSDILVILAGYKEEMDNMLSINTGLRGRFPHQWHFDNYSCEELMQIAYTTLEQEQYTLSPEADMRLQKVVTQQLIANDKEFSNARWIKQYITHSILPTMAQRVSQHPHCNDRTIYSTIEACDIPFTDKESTLGIKKRNRIGYCTLQQYEAA